MCTILYVKRNIRVLLSNKLNRFTLFLAFFFSPLLFSKFDLENSPPQNSPQYQFPIQNTLPTQFIHQPLPTLSQPLTIKLHQDNNLL